MSVQTEHNLIFFVYVDLLKDYEDISLSYGFMSYI